MDGYGGLCGVGGVICRNMQKYRTQNSDSELKIVGEQDNIYSSVGAKGKYNDLVPGNTEKYGPRIGQEADGTGLKLTGKIIVYGRNNVDITANHFEEAIKSWNFPRIPASNSPTAPNGQPLKDNQHGVVFLNGQPTSVRLDIQVEKKTFDQVRSELQVPAPDRVYILAGNDSLADYEENATLLSNRNLAVTPNDFAYLNTLLANPLAQPGGVAGRLIMGGLTPVSFLIGNMGFYDLARSQARGGTSAAHELGHWLSHLINTNLGWNSHVPSTLNNPIPVTPNGNVRSIMSFDAEAHKRTPTANDVSNIGFGQDFSIFNSAPNRPTANYLGDRLPNGQLLLFNQNEMFTNPTQAAIFQALFGGIQFWTPNNMPTLPR